MRFLLPTFSSCGNGATRHKASFSLQPNTCGLPFWAGFNSGRSRLALPQADVISLHSLTLQACTLACSSYILAFSFVLLCASACCWFSFHITPYHLATPYMFFKIQIYHHLSALSPAFPSPELDSPPSFGSHSQLHVTVLWSLFYCRVKLQPPRCLPHRTLSSPADHLT